MPVIPIKGLLRPVTIAEILEEGAMLKITRAKNADVVFGVSGRLDSENMAELNTLLSSEPNGQHIVLDLRELTLVDEDAVRFLVGCEAYGIELKNCPTYVREWIKRERGAS